MKTVKLNEDFKNAIRGDLHRVIENIYNDVFGNLENPCNADLIEIALDQRHQCSKKTIDVIDEAIELYGYDKVFNFLNRSMRYI